METLVNIDVPDLDAARFSDPFGNGFCFVQWSGAGYDGVD